jgi:hypothetical protein
MELNEILYKLVVETAVNIFAPHNMPALTALTIVIFCAALFKKFLK